VARRLEREGMIGGAFLGETLGVEIVPQSKFLEWNSYVLPHRFPSLPPPSLSGKRKL